MSQIDPDKVDETGYVDYSEYDNQAGQEEHFEVVPADFNLRRDLHKLSETVDELRCNLSALEFSGFQLRCMLSYHTILINNEKMNNDGTEVLDSDLNEDSSTLGSSE